MNILIIGSGAREHAIAKCLKRSVFNPHIYCCGTSLNPGIEQLVTGYWTGDITQVGILCEIAVGWEIKLAVIGPEAPLEKGLADALWNCGIPVIGPKRKLAQLETSKSFTRNLMKHYQIPGLPKYQYFTDMVGVAEFLEELGEGNYVVKVDGLMAGKGVKVAGDHLHSLTEALEHCQVLFAQKHRVLIEEKLIGQEFSLMCFTDGTSLVPMPLVQDNKRAYEGDMGPNTGGMGSFSAADHSLPFLMDSDVQIAMEINELVLRALQTEIKDRYVGIVYGGFIATSMGVYVIEFNARFGDPESLNVLSILESDLVALFSAMTEGTLDALPVQFARQATVCKYAVPQGYPDRPLEAVEIEINGIKDDATLYLAGVDEKNGKLYATGSRTAAVVGVASSISQAECLAEEAISMIKGPLFHRKDIGTSDLINQRMDFMRKVRSL
ncbi:MAG: phosphoribosylamine--glycine ligase [Legionellales bacterium]